MKKEKKELNKEIEKIYLKIQEEWKLSGELVKDFTKVAILEFNQESDFKNDLNPFLLNHSVISNAVLATSIANFNSLL